MTGGHGGLAQTLHTLEREGYVSRKVYPTISPKVEYSLTAPGRLLLTKVQPPIAWADENHARVRRARKGYVPPCGQWGFVIRDWVVRNALSL